MLLSPVSLCRWHQECYMVNYCILMLWCRPSQERIKNRINHIFWFNYNLHLKFKWTIFIFLFQNKMYLACWLLYFLFKSLHIVYASFHLLCVSVCEFQTSWPDSTGVELKIKTERLIQFTLQECLLYSSSGNFLSSSLPSSLLHSLPELTGRGRREHQKPTWIIGWNDLNLILYIVCHVIYFE